MEKTLELSGKDFEEKCQSCPCLLSFNRQKSKGKDVVYVVCRVEQCVKPVAITKGVAG